MENLTELGAAGILVLLILKEVFNFTTKGRQKPHEEDGLKQLEAMVKQMTEMAQQVRTLYVWHSPNQEGVQLWKGDARTLSAIDTTLQELKVVLHDLRRSRDA